MISSEFISKIEFACNKKESLYSQSKFKYAIRSMFAGAFLTFSTAAGAVGADLINKIAPGSVDASSFHSFLLGAWPTLFF